MTFGVTHLMNPTLTGLLQNYRRYNPMTGCRSLAWAPVIDDLHVTASGVSVSACPHVLRHSRCIGLSRPTRQFFCKYLVPACIPGQRRSQFSHSCRRPVLPG